MEYSRGYGLGPSCGLPRDVCLSEVVLPRERNADINRVSTSTGLVGTRVMHEHLETVLDLTSPEGLREICEVPRRIPDAVKRPMSMPIELFERVTGIARQLNTPIEEVITQLLCADVAELS